MAKPDFTPIRSANISGIGARRVATLADYGLTTAYDVLVFHQRKPEPWEDLHNIGESLWHSLHRWARQQTTDREYLTAEEMHAEAIQSSRDRYQSHVRALNSSLKALIDSVPPPLEKPARPEWQSSGSTSDDGCIGLFLGIPLGVLGAYLGFLVARNLLQDVIAGGGGNADLAVMGSMFLSFVSGTVFFVLGVSFPGLLGQYQYSWAQDAFKAREAEYDEQLRSYRKAHKAARNKVRGRHDVGLWFILARGLDESTPVDANTLGPAPGDIEGHAKLSSRLRDEYNGAIAAAKAWEVAKNATPESYLET